jgi:riboflavin kinase/FMN adenylyltransferase
MEVVRLEPVPSIARPAAPGVVTIGNFDGVHRGHQALVRAARERATLKGEACLALTFDPHPAAILHPERAPLSLTTVAQKAELLSALGVDILAVLPFTPTLASLSPAEFARDVLVEVLGARAVVVGDGFRFGKARAGDVGELRRLGEGLGFEVVAVPAVLHDGARVSSTRVRESLLAGDVEAAASLLGRPYFVDGRVVRGDGRGRTLGIPTANLAVDNEIQPKEGVYAARVGLPDGGPLRFAVVNLGRRPTFGGGAATTEAHLLDFEGDLYERRLRVFFVARLREERRFSGREALVDQIQEDVRSARSVLAGGGDGL